MDAIAFEKSGREMIHRARGNWNAQRIFYLFLKVGFAADVTQQSKLYSAKECVATQTARILSFVVHEVMG
jgi:hypothetical protein